MSFIVGFEKTALNALKARQLAKQHKLVPEGAWKWALRNLRRGKTRQQLGAAPDKLIGRVRRAGSKVEAGAYWDKSTDPKKVKLDTGTEHGMLLGGQERLERFTALTKKPGLSEKVNSPDLKHHGEVNREMKQFAKTVAHLNSIHSHPAGQKKFVKDVELVSLDALKSAPSFTRKDLENAMPHLPKKHLHRYEKLIPAHRQKIIAGLEERYKSKHPNLMPSGYDAKKPYDPQGTDVQQFKSHNIGTHHNIVDRTGLGIHTVRPDKKKGGKWLRSVLFHPEAKKKK